MPAGNNDGYYEVFWPRAPRQARVKPVARRPQSLDGKTVAELWDFLFRGDEIFGLLEEGIKARFPDVRFVSWREFGSIHGAKEREVLAGLPERFKDLGVDAVVSGMAC
ncbi:MAG: hypothetical protein HY323_09445 [Betaproteobacteria bacterium]|nr:hypothetical protein [Betaproteobacteria bacterium]